MAHEACSSEALLLPPLLLGLSRPLMFTALVTLFMPTLVLTALWPTSPLTPLLDREVTRLLDLLLQTAPSFGLSTLLMVLSTRPDMMSIRVAMVCTPLASRPSVACTASPTLLTSLPTVSIVLKRELPAPASLVEG